MIQSKRKFYRSGVDYQRTPDITINLIRPESAKMGRYTEEQRLDAIEFILGARIAFNEFIEAIERELDHGEYAKQA